MQAGAGVAQEITEFLDLRPRRHREFRQNLRGQRRLQQRERLIAAQCGLANLELRPLQPPGQITAFAHRCQHRVQARDVRHLGPCRAFATDAGQLVRRLHIRRLRTGALRRTLAALGQERAQPTQAGPWRQRLDQGVGVRVLPAEFAGELEQRRAGRGEFGLALRQIRALAPDLDAALMQQGDVLLALQQGLVAG
jgi:hypothetical protein